MVSQCSVLSPLIDRDLLAADFLVSIFWSAMMSYRYDTVLRPFPPSFVDPTNTSSNKNVRELVRPLILMFIVYVAIQGII
jgi:poly[ADP-ribose] polymerase 16